MYRKKLAKQGVALPAVDDEPDWLRLIRFKPTHEAFRSLQDHYIGGRGHLDTLLTSGKKRLIEVEAELKEEEAKFEQMCSSYLGNDIKITKRVVEETSGVVANSRKRDIMNLFTEV